MKQKINVVIHKTGSENSFILDCIGQLNSGKSLFTIRDLEGYLNMKKSFLPYLGKGYCIVKDTEQSNTWHISEDSAGSYTLSLEFVEVYELQPETENLPPDYDL